MATVLPPGVNAGVPVVTASASPTRGQMESRVLAAGFTFMDATELTNVVQEAATEFTFEELWPWRLQVVEAVSPITIVNRGPIDSVVDITTGLPLQPRRWSEIEDDAGILNQPAGSPGLYYYLGTGGLIVTYPVTVDIQVRHYVRAVWADGKVASTSTSSVLLAPLEDCECIYLLAVSKAYAYNNNPVNAAEWRRMYENRLASVREQELQSDVDQPEMVLPTEGW